MSEIRSKSSPEIRLEIYSEFLLGLYSEISLRIFIKNSSLLQSTNAIYTDLYVLYRFRFIWNTDFWARAAIPFLYGIQVFHPNCVWGTDFWKEWYRFLKKSSGIPASEILRARAWELKKNRFGSGPGLINFKKFGYGSGFNNVGFKSGCRVVSGNLADKPPNPFSTVFF